MPISSEKYKTWVEIDRDALAHNTKLFRSILKPRTLMFAVVKSNAYGHGLRTFSCLADSLGVDGFCVDSVAEGHALRGQKITKPILTLGPTFSSSLEEAAADDITLSISNFDLLKVFLRKKLRIEFHIKLDTGMRRQGFYPEEVPRLIKMIRAYPVAKTQLRGVFTHLASAKDITYPDFTLRQIDQFKKSLLLFKQAGLRHIMAHVAATGGVALYPAAHFDAVRIGIGLYGHWPTKEAAVQHRTILGKRLELRSVLSWRARINEVKKLRVGDYVGYDLTEKVRKPCVAAIIPIGYWHGFSRSLSGNGEVLINGVRCCVIGRVSMDLITVGLPRGVRVKVGDMATLIGKSGRDVLDAEEFAEKAGSIHYEVLSRLNPLMHRTVI